MENFNNIDDSNLMGSNGLSNSDRRIVNSGKNGTKRSVSETKKKYVASQQDWKCGHCEAQLDHTFEIDHRVRLEYGGGNDVQNLVALCRNCHGKKTASENM
jgi:5-methylcytosine-specific restriction endonuclease McrA